MTTVGLYGNSPSGVVAPATGSESTGLYGNNVNFGGSYFEWFIFQQSETQPATPTGGSWSFTTNSGTAPTGWTSLPPSAPTTKVWVSIALVNSKNTSTLSWSVPGLFSYASGLPIFSGNGTPAAGLGQSDQLYIQLDTNPQTIWFKESGTWTRLTGSSLYVDLTNNQTIAGTKTFSSTIQGSVSGTASNVTGVVGITNGGTGSTTASGARTALGAAASGANSDITSMAALTGDIASPTSISMGNGNAVTLAAGRMWYSPNTGAWNLGMGGGNITQQVGEELFLYGKASAAITDSPLQIVYQTGTVGASGVVTFAPTVAGITNGDLIVGVATESIALNAFGRVTTFGVIHGITTNGTAYGETWADGDTIWYNPVTGNPTKNKPSAPNIKVSLGTVISAGPGGSGSFQVEINHGSVLGGTDSNVQLTSVVNANLLQYDSAAGYWKNVAPSAVTGVGSLANALTIGTGLSGTSYNGSSTVTIANTGVLSFSAGTTGLTPSTATTGAVTLAGTLAIANGGTGATTAAAAATNLGLGTGNSPSFTGLTISGGTANGVAYLNGSKVLTTGTALTFDGTNFATTGTATASKLIPTSSSTAGNGMYLPAANILGWSINGAEAMRLDGNLLIGTTTNTNSSKLVVNGTISETVSSIQYLVASQYDVGTAPNKIPLNQYLGNLAYQDAANIAGQVGHSLGTAALPSITFSTNTNTGMWSPATNTVAWSTNGSETMRLTSTGLGIGMSSPGARLDITSTAAFSARITGPSNVYQDITDGTGTLRLQLLSNAPYLTSIGAYPFSFGTNNTERMRLDAAGNLLVGLTSATGVAKFQVSGPLRTTGYTVSTLPAGTVGMRTYVTDALAPSFGATVVGGGAVTIPVFYNGTNWIVA